MKKALVIPALLLAISAVAQNPYMPLWEFIPDGEPYVFDDPDNPGKQRIYVYGSHDNGITMYCGRDQVVWSAPVENLFDWRCDGIIFVSDKDAEGNPLYEEGIGDVLYAPDVAIKTLPDGTKQYYLYPNNQAWGRNGQVAVSSRPDGPFEVCNWSSTNPRVAEGVLAFDPAVFVDEDGKVYGYWGFERSYGAELDPETMATVKPGTEIVTDMVSGKNQPGVFRFFEASSMRKIKNKYVFIYSRQTEEGEFGLPNTNYTLAYAYSDNPLGPYTYGGTIIDGRARGLDAEGNVIPTANPHGNTHGSIQKIGRNWWVFYHRQTGTDQYSRQAMVAPVKVKVQSRKGGKVIISEGEYNSEGFRTEGLDPLQTTSAGLCCYYTNPGGVENDFPYFRFTGSYIQAFRDSEGTCAVVNNTAGSVIGYKYFNFKKLAKAFKKGKVSLTASIKPMGVDGTIKILIGAPDEARGGRLAGTFELEAGAPQDITPMTATLAALKGVKGKQPVYFSFESDTHDVSLCEIYDLKFSIK